MGHGFEEIHRFARGSTFGRQSANFVEDGGGLVVVVDELCVCGLAVVVIPEATADTEDSGGQLVMAENPSAHVELVRAVVAEFAATCGPYPVPVVVQLLAFEWQQGGWARPQIVVDTCRDRAGAVDLSQARAILVTTTAGETNLAKVAGLYPLNGLVHGLSGSLVEVPLDHTIVFSRSPDELAALEDVV